jgi:hypothetical protein
MFSYLNPFDGPVVEGMEKFEVVFAKEQPQYIPLRAIVSRDAQRNAMSRWTFTPEQRKAIYEGADIYLRLSTFGEPLQPISICVTEKWEPAWVRQEFNLPKEEPAKRTVLVLVGIEWVKREFKDLKKGDTFRVQEPDGTFVEVNGQSHSIADDDAFFENGRWCVNSIFTMIADATLEKAD